MKETETENKHAKRGVFWVVDGALLAFPFDGAIPEATAKRGNTYNHKRLWEHVSHATSRLITTREAGWNSTHGAKP